MRFTRIPLIATLLAGALSLLVVLPAIAQSTQGVETDGRQSVGGALEVQVYENIADIRARGIAAVPVADRFGLTGALPTGESDPTVTRGHEALSLRDETDDTANDYSRIPDPQNTYFNGRLYVSNDNFAYNTILITAQVPDGTAGLVTRNNADTEDDPLTTDVDESLLGWTTRVGGGAYTSAGPADCAIADIRNTRSGKKAKVALFAVGGAGDSVVESGNTVYQGVLTVWDRSTDRVEEADSECTNLPVEDPVIEPDPRQDPWRASSGNQPAAVMAARDGDTIEITVSGVRGRLTLTVDGDKPTLSALTPEDGGTTNNARVTLGFTVSDDGSGLRFDAEDGLSGDGDSSPANGDNDQRYNEPLASRSGADPGNGASEDIQVYYAGDEDGITDTVTDSTDSPCDSACMRTLGVQPPPPGDAAFATEFEAEEYSRFGTNGWTEVALGRTYRLAMVLNSQSFDGYEWMVVAKDRVGNTATTDGNDDEDGPQPFTFDLDNEDPMISTVRTGVQFDSSSNPPKEKANRAWIALSIVNEDDGGEDRVDRSSVQASDFTVSGATVVDAVVPTNKKGACDDSDKAIKDIDGGCGFDPRAVIYLQLSEELEADQTPTVQVLGGVFMDIAGNPNTVQSRSGGSEITDKIKPKVDITVTATGDATNRPATNDDGEFTVRIETDEDLRSFPSVWFATIDGVALGAAGDDAKVGTTLGVGALGPERPREVSRNVWEVKVDEGDLPGSGPRLVAVLVRAEDENQNVGNSPGWTLARSTDANPSPEDYDHDSDPDTPDRPITRLDFNKLDDGGFLIEVDSNDVADPTVTVSPPAEGETRITESLTPYVQLNFTGEANEYGIDERGGDAIFYKGYAGEDDDPIKTDSHEGVELTKLTVDGEDRLSDVRRVGSSKNSFIIAFVEGLDIGRHEVVFAAKDDVGNELAANSAGVREETFSFTVRSRAGYKVNLRPGWNLISLPGTPENPAVSAVLNGLEANTVLSYQEGEWLSAIRPDDGEWQGTLEQMAGGYGYWVQTTAAETITAVIPPTLPNQVLPTVPITSGWNLVGVIDAAQRAVGTSAVNDPDKYFVNVSWRVAYGFETEGSRWVKILPKPSGTDDGANDMQIKNGSGYWLWSTEPGVLVP